MGKHNTFKDLEAHWYRKLAKDGFRDAENTNLSDRPLKEWHSFKFCPFHYKTKGRRRLSNPHDFDEMLALRGISFGHGDANNELRLAIKNYYIQLDNLLNHNEWDSICRSFIKHGNNSLTVNKVKMVLELHANGNTERGIAFKVKCGKKCVHTIIWKAREWMKIL